jgi:hypothetical protein
MQPNIIEIKASKQRSQTEIETAEILHELQSFIKKNELLKKLCLIKKISGSAHTVSWKFLGEDSIFITQQEIQKYSKDTGHMGYSHHIMTSLQKLSDYELDTIYFELETGEKKPLLNIIEEFQLKSAKTYINNRLNVKERPKTRKKQKIQ